jgi:cyanate permease
VIGAGIGLGCSLLPALNQFIQTNDPEAVMLIIIGAWCAAVLIGALVGFSLAALARQHVSREWPAEGEQGSRPVRL